MHFICSECGKACKETIHTINDPLNFICFDCSFWLSKLGHYDDPNHVRIDGHYFVVADGSHAGFGGREFKIVRNDGRELTTKDLWCLGKIDALFVDRLPDNAVFVNIKHKPVPDDVPF